MKCGLPLRSSGSSRKLAKRINRDDYRKSRVISFRSEVGNEHTE
jgi:hypothetical protein